MAKELKHFLYPSDVQEKLDFNWLKQQVSKYCYGPLGQQQVNEWRPLDSEDLAIAEQARIVELMENRRDGKKLSAAYFSPLDQLWEKLPMEAFILELEELAEIRRFLLSVREVFDYLLKAREKYPALGNLLSDLHWDGSSLKAIDRVLDEENRMRNDASPELVKIRRKQLDKQHEIGKVFKNLLRKMKKAGMLSEAEESVRGGRRVFSVPAEHKRQMPGIIHDESDSGKSIFIEPMETVSLHNDLAELEIEERKEIRRILKTLSADLRPFTEQFFRYQELLAQVDSLNAKAVFSEKIDAKAVLVATDAPLRLIQAYHPHLLWHNREKNQDTIPLNISLSSDNRVLVVSGPNAGGKSIALKTVGMLQLMALHGLPLPASENSSLPFLSKILADIGDAQSIEDELSTYSSRLRRMNVFLKEADSNSLILIDEFGTGTDPDLGGAMAEAILDKLAESQAFGIVTTHYANLKALANNTPGLENGRMVFDEKNLAPTFRLEQGKPGSSYTFEVAKNSGLPKWLIQSAKERVATENIDLEDLLQKLQKDREQLEKREQDLLQENRKLRKLMQQMESMQKDLENQRKRLSYEFKQFKAEELARKESMIREFEKQLKEKQHSKNDLAEIRSSIQAKKEQVSADAKGLKKDLFIKEGKAEILEGSKVRMIDSEIEGIVESIRKGKAKVRFGMIRSEVPVNELVAIDQPKEEVKRAGKHEVSRGGLQGPELDLRGMYADEAVKQVEQALDQAVVSGVRMLRIIHGKGTGKLRQAVLNALKRYPHLESYGHPPAERGGDGVTEVLI